MQAQSTTFFTLAWSPQSKRVVSPGKRSYQTPLEKWTHRVNPTQVIASSPLREEVNPDVSCTLPSFRKEKNGIA